MGSLSGSEGQKSKPRVVARLHRQGRPRTRRSRKPRLSQGPGAVDLDKRPAMAFIDLPC